MGANPRKNARWLMEKRCPSPILAHHGTEMDCYPLCLALRKMGVYVHSLSIALRRICRLLCPVRLNLAPPFDRVLKSYSMPSLGILGEQVQCYSLFVHKDD